MVVVVADNKRQAKVEGVRELRRTKSDWVQDQESDGRSPFAGLKVHLYDDCTCKECSGEEVPDAPAGSPREEVPDAPAGSPRGEKGCGYDTCVLCGGAASASTNQTKEEVPDATRNL